MLASVVKLCLLTVGSIPICGTATLIPIISHHNTNGYLERATTMLFLSVSSGKYSVGTTYGPFVHWQAIADWLDANPRIRDDYKHVIHRGTEGVNDGPSLDEFNKPYAEVRTLGDVILETGSFTESVELSRSTWSLA
jgi:hypothetical protein